MQIPRKIDDRLQDAIVSIQFEPGVPGNAVEGYFHSVLKDMYNTVSLNQPGTIKIDQLIVQPQQTFYIIGEGKFRVEVNANSITFNLIGSYTGWDEYSKTLTTTLSPLIEKGIIAKISRIGIRYISVFDHIRIFDHLKSSLHLEPFDQTSSRAQFRIELEQGPFLMIVTLINAFPKTDGGIYSITDVDTIKVFDSIKIQANEVLEWLEKGHSEQKKVFFSLLKQDFIDSLNPIY